MMVGTDCSNTTALRHPGVGRDPWSVTIASLSALRTAWIPTYAGMTTAVLAAFMALAAPAQADTTQLLNGLENVRQNHDLTGLVGVRFSGAKTEAVAVGCAAYAADGRTCQRQLTTDHRMRVASISKLVTNLAVMTLVERGKLDLDRDVSDYVGFRFRNPAFPDAKITLRMLLSHTSSLRDGEVYWVDFPGELQSLMGNADRWDKAKAPGQYFTYCNLAYGVMGQIVERASGERFDLYVNRVILKPLGISGGFNWSNSANVPGDKVAVLYRVREGKWTAQVDDFGGAAPSIRVRGVTGDAGPAVDRDYRIGSNGTLFGPQGSLRISANELTKIARLFAGGGQTGGLRIIKPATMRAMLTPQWRLNQAGDNGASEGGFFTGYGLGVHLSDAFGPPRLAGHYAEAFGLRGGLLVDPKRNRGWIYLLTGSAKDQSADLDPALPGHGKAEADAWRVIMQKPLTVAAGK
jgi:CubicO group peptidase (beta-lactamase class C family)